MHYIFFFNQRGCLPVVSYSSEGSVITVLILFRELQHQLMEEQHGLQNTSSNHPSVAIVYQKHMRVWCLFIIMRMKISSIWLLLHTALRLYWMCPSTCRSFCSQIQKPEPHLTSSIPKLKLQFFECQEFISTIFVPSCIWHTDTLRTRNHFPLSGFAPEVIRSLDIVNPLLLFSLLEDRPQGSTQQ